MRPTLLVTAGWLLLGSIAAPTTEREMLDRCMQPPASRTALIILWLPDMAAALATPSEC